VARNISLCMLCVCVCYQCILFIIHVRFCIIQNVVDYGFCSFAVRSLCIGLLLKYDYRTEPDQIEGDFELNRTGRRKWLRIKCE